MSSIPNSIPKAPRDYLVWTYRALFVLVVPIAILMANKPKPQVSLPFLTRRLPAYHVILANDIYMKWVDKSNVVAGTILDKRNIIGHYTLTPIRDNKPILENQIGPKPDSSLITNTLAVAIPASSVTILGGNLLAGDIVSIASVPLSNATSLPRIVFDLVLVLDVKQFPQNQAIIILAIPVYRWPNFLAELRDATVVIALREE